MTISQEGALRSALPIYIASGLPLRRQNYLFRFYRYFNLYKSIFYPVNHIFVDNHLIGESR